MLELHTDTARRHAASKHDDKNLPTPHSQYHGGWCPGDARNRGISTHDSNCWTRIIQFPLSRVNQAWSFSHCTNMILFMCKIQPIVCAYLVGNISLGLSEAYMCGKPGFAVRHAVRWSCYIASHWTASWHDISPLLDVNKACPATYDSWQPRFTTLL